MAAQLVVSRRWHQPTITVDVTADSIALTMSFDDVVRALAVELGNPVGILTREQLRVRLEAAAARVVQGVKDASALAPPIPARETIAPTTPSES